MVGFGQFGMNKKQYMLEIECHLLEMLREPAHSPTDEESIMSCEVLRVS